MTVVEHPLSRTDEQRLGALREANRIRVHRARLKKLVKAGAIDAAAVLAEPTADVETMHVAALLRAMPKHGPAKVTRLMRQVGISDAKTIGGLSDRQRNELVKELAIHG